MMSCCEIPAEKVRAQASSAICEACGNKAHKVERLTVEHMIRGERQFEIADAQYYFCRTPGCDVVYFSEETGQRFTKADVRVRVSLKETEGPVVICYCFDFTEAMLRDEPTSIPELIKSRIKAGRCACEVKNPSGRCCLGEVNKAVKRLMKEREAPAAKDVGACGAGLRKLRNSCDP
jgi:hypothetical protein